jgi:hypothetical protein
MKQKEDAERAGSFSKQPGASQVQFFFQKLRPQSTAEVTSPIKSIPGFSNDGQCRRMFLIWQKRSESNGCF